MKIFIGSDIEGVADLASFDEAGSENLQLYTRGMMQMSKEVGAACRGAGKAGATTITVKDAHSRGLNVFHEYLPEMTTLVRGSVREPFSMIGSVDKSYDALFFIGYHDAAGENGNPMSHTMNSRRIHSVEINDTRVGEFHIFAYAAAYLGIPVALIAGDESICEKAKCLQPNIVTVPTKKGIGAAVASVHPALSERLIEEGAQKALLGDIARHTIALPERFRVMVSYNKHYDAKERSYYPGAEIVDSHTIAFDSEDYYEVLRFFHFVL